MNPTDRQEMLRHGDITRVLIRLSVPAIFAMLTIALYNVVDTFYIGLLGDTASIGASAVLFPIFMIISSIGLMFGVGAGSAISRRLGAGEGERANGIASTAVITCAVTGVVFSTAGVIHIESILKLFGATETIIDRAVKYGTIIIGGSIFQMLNMCMNNLIRAEGASTYSGRAMMGGALLNIILDPIFMFAFRLGIAGAAWATITAQAFSTVYLFRFFLTRRGLIRIAPVHADFSLENYSDIMKIGIPTAIRQILASVSMGVLNNSASEFGDWAVAAIGIVLRLLTLVLYVIFGLGQGFQPLAGFNYGARQFDRVKESLRVTVIISTCVCFSFSVVFILFAPFLLGLFSNDRAVIQIGGRALRFSSYTLILLGFQNTAGIFFQALGRGRETALLSMARQGFFLIPLAWLLPKFLGVDGIIFSQPAADLLTAAITVLLLSVNLRHLKREERDLYDSAESQPRIIVD